MMNSNKKYDCIVCGAGPAGLMAAITVAQSKKSVLLIERMKKTGRKLIATGGGRCNLTNKTPLNKFINAFDNKENFVKSALKQFSPDNLIDFFEEHGLKTIAPNGLQVYPASEKSTDVLNCLMKTAEENHVEIITDCEMNCLIVKENKVSGISAGENTYLTSAVIMATGGKSYPELGSNGSGYKMAQAVGHEINFPVPALCGLLTNENWPAMCSGLSIDNAIAYIEDPLLRSIKKRGSILFTHKGISGPAALDISKYVSRSLQKSKQIRLRIRPLPDKRRENLSTFLVQAQQKMGNKRLRILLGEMLPARLVSQILFIANIDNEIRAADVKREQKNKLLDIIESGIPLSINAVENFSNAMVTSGGISCEQIDPHTMQSKIVSGLFFCGELIDVDGPCGGFNLQWAFSSGYVAGKASSDLF